MIVFLFFFIFFFFFSSRRRHTRLQGDWSSDVCSSDLAAEFGRQCVVLAIDARRTGSAWEALTHGGRKPGRPDAVEWAREAAGLGAGEILLTSWDRDGTRAGPDLELLRAVLGAVRVPVIASGGIGERGDRGAGALAGAGGGAAAARFP